MVMSRRALRATCFVLFVTSVAIAISARLCFLAFLLERDEGEYAYAGQLLLQRISPYKLVARAGVFAAFRYSAIDYAAPYGALISPAEGLQFLWSRIPQLVNGDWLRGVIGICGAIASLVVRKFFNFAPTLIALLICSAAAVSPAFYFRPHYFILMLPSVALAAGAVLGAMATNAVPRWISLAAVIFALAFPLFHHPGVLFRDSLAELARPVD